MKSDLLKQNSVQWLRLLVGLIVVFALFQWLAETLKSYRGEFGVIVGVIVVAATIFAEKLLFKKSFNESIKTIGLKNPTKTGLLTGIAICVLMLLTIPLFAFATSSTFSFYPNWQFLILGLFFQAGIAEETLFRGYLFGHFRQKYSFWKAALLAAIPFILVHLIMFYSQPFPIALASIILAVVMSFPFCRLFELDGNSIWSPAILHFIVQGTVKVLVVSDESAQIFPLFWIMISAIIPFGGFAAPYFFKRR
ncbi:MAG: CPBP family intramembrane metalloprotease [Pyrinomonadaceae bacterium]|nr:CPBP family intramembrane metalloprotease [Pyrinomonadaceae bacterium]